MRIRIILENNGEQKQMGRIELGTDNDECFIADELLHYPKGPKWIADELLGWSSQVLKAAQQ
ncbi:hypothetical protein [Bifidobacterium mongoliense]|jgi:hypothetical protein|uniref:hypothetical protein n=1 Tax=Bifidobacterium mongoliense TaxID=518643 RepID=UPI0030EDD617